MTNEITQLSAQIGQLLLARQACVTTAESCTGGGIAEAITRIAGSSSWFETGFVAYSNQAKHELLAVPAELIAKHGAVSEPVVLAMVRGAVHLAAADFGVAVSGIAGPGGGSKEKPVGTVWLAWAAPNGNSATRFQFDGDRGEVRLQAIRQALVGLIELAKNTV